MILIKKDQRVIVCAKYKKISIVITKLTGSEVLLRIKKRVLAIIFFQFFQAKQIKKGVVCVQILLEIHQTEHSRVHFQV